MGLFTFLKNGLTLEKKKKVETEPVVDEESTDVEEAPDEPIPVAPEPQPQTSAEKRLEAECILYGDTYKPANSAPAPTPTATAETTTQQTTPVQQTYHAYTNVTSPFNNALLGQATVNQNLLVAEPQTPDEMSPILSNLASGNACIVSLAKIANAQRHLDYLCGFINAIGGTIMQRSQTEYILTPPGVGIKNKN